MRNQIGAKSGCLEGGATSERRQVADCEGGETSESRRARRSKWTPKSVVLPTSERRRMPLPTTDEGATTRNLNRLIVDGCV